MGARRVEREAWVISDLHVGGAWPEPGGAGGRGFRLLTRGEALAAFVDEVAGRALPGELVVNGDFVDFLAEEHEAEERWLPFLADPALAAATFDRIAGRDRPLFEALGRLLGRGKGLTILLGNHDVELALPAVRQRLAVALGPAAASIRFLYDGEALRIGDALVEHGNRYDPLNAVDHDSLRRLRSLQSRGSPPGRQRFEPPAGSRLVAAVLNPLKEQFPFLDLLKPESEPLFALVLALDPSVRTRLPAALWALRDAPGAGGREAPAPQLALLALLERCLGREAGAFLADVDASAAAGDASPPAGRSPAGKERGPLGPALALAELLLCGERAGWERRVRALRAALTALDEDRSFDAGVETGRRYREAAEALSRGRDGRPRHAAVVFGHTHLARELRLTTGATYVNTGTWADRMRFPAALRDPDPEAARSALIAFLEDMRAGRLEPYVEFHPTYARIGVDAEGGAVAELGEFDWRRGRLE